MNSMETIYSHPFFTEIVADEKLINSKGAKHNLSINYIKDVGFYLANYINLLSQLELAVEIVSNFDYRDKDKINRGALLAYNYENYLVRIISTTDRLLQLVNAIYNLNIPESKVNYKRVIGHSTIIGSSIELYFQNLKQLLNPFYYDRNSIIHRNSYFNKELQHLMTFYDPLLIALYNSTKPEADIQNLRNFKTRLLTKFIKNTKKEFADINDKCFDISLRIFDVLHQKYSLYKVSV